MFFFHGSQSDSDLEVPLGRSNLMRSSAFAQSKNNRSPDDSSSEDVQPNRHSIVGGKPAVPPRSRSVSNTRNPIATMNRHTNDVNSNLSDDMPCKDNDSNDASGKWKQNWNYFSIRSHKMIKTRSFCFFVFFCINFSELTVYFEHNRSINGYNEFGYAIAPKTQEQRWYISVRHAK